MLNGALNEYLKTLEHRFISLCQNYSRSWPIPLLLTPSRINSSALALHGCNRLYISKSMACRAIQRDLRPDN